MLQDAEEGPWRPKLLVSVRDAREAVAALAGGCDILDVKEPRNGPLGMADVATIAAVVAVARDSPVPPPVSAALGEIGDWPTNAEVPGLPSGLDYVKTGLAGCTMYRNGHNHPALAASTVVRDSLVAREDDWRSRWFDVRRQFEKAAAAKPSWIAVAYGDWTLASAPHPAEVIEAAAMTDCTGVLFDTYTKDGRGLFDRLTETDLSGFVRQIRRQGLMLALAGGIRTDQLSRVAALRPDIIAIRTAGCRDGIRTAEICAEAVGRFRAAVEALV
jgi:(5-formylfuran-3-yl)methyl phosphate synthase